MALQRGVQFIQAGAAERDMLHAPAGQVSGEDRMGGAVEGLLADHRVAGGGQGEQHGANRTHA